MSLEAHNEAIAQRTTQLIDRLALGQDISGVLTDKRRSILTAELRLMGVEDVNDRIAQRLAQLTQVMSNSTSI